MTRPVTAFILSLCLLTSLVLPTAGSAFGERPDDFAVVLLPDTQYYAETFPATYLEQTAWIKARAKKGNIRFVIHLGDLVQLSDSSRQWAVADEAHKKLEGVVPYSLAVGNHDLDVVDNNVTHGVSQYHQYFPPSRFEPYPWYGGHLGEDNANNFCFFEGGGMKFMVLSLEFAPREATLAWADKIVAGHPDHRIIVATHYYLNTEGRPDEKKPYGLDGAGPEDLWQRFISKHENIFMVVCGHIPGVRHQTSVNEAGGTVHEILCDYQGERKGGSGWLQTLRFVPEEDKIYVEAYSTTLDKHNQAPEHTYVLPYEMVDK